MFSRPRILVFLWYCSVMLWGPEYLLADAWRSPFASCISLTFNSFTDCSLGALLWGGVGVLGAFVWSGRETLVFEYYVGLKSSLR